MSEYENKLNNLSEDNKNLASNYFTKAEMLEKLFGVVRSKFEFKSPFGNFNSKVVVVFDYDKLDGNIIKLIKKFYELNGQDFNNIYLTPYHKTINDAINAKLLSKELEIIKPDRVISLGHDIQNLCSESMCMNSADFKFYCDCLADKSKMTSKEYSIVKSSFTAMMKFIITGNK
jgi:hypothetical protein